MSGAGKPVTEGESWLSRTTKVPAVDITIHSASGERVRVVGGEVDVGDGAAVTLERVLNGTRS